MTSAIARQTRDEIHRIIQLLVKKGFADDQVLPYINKVDANSWEVTSKNVKDIGASAWNMRYEDMHALLLKHRAFNVKMPDGALLQLFYQFDREEIRRHRLAFFPDPRLDEYQNDPEVYETEVIFAEVCDLRVVSTPLRFDFDREGFIEMDHPMSHLTLGQYKNCRIAMAKPVTPFLFFHFIMNAFYKTAASSIADELRGIGVAFEETITRAERSRIHLSC